ncbi:hypothetical protein [Psychrobacter sp. I-STPA10]|uniref:hypothetical protein n=1 Tax=Psychrobacter sp. I-STPA10 TaxID=2585769 RepID=UPI001E3193F8|nr:hypothetical protein [Psychrobacter sp. I-STPA10]
MATTFDEFIQELEQEVDNQPEINWDAKKQSWLNYLDQFYTQIKNYLQPYIERGAIKLKEETIEVHEEYIGQYSVNQLILTLGRETVYLIPKGTNLIGAKGRVDMNSSKGNVRFVLVDKNSHKPAYSYLDLPRTDNYDPEWVWKIATLPPNINFYELTQESFQDALMEVVNG